MWIVAEWGSATLLIRPAITGLSHSRFLMCRQRRFEYDVVKFFGNCSDGFRMKFWKFRKEADRVLY